jgi:hypothetical protein
MFETHINRPAVHREPMRRRVDIMPVLIIFVIAIFVLGLGAVSSLPIVVVLGVFLVILIAAFVVLARSMIRR